MAGPAPDRMFRTLSEQGGVAVRAIVGTGVVAEAARRHATSTTATAALGRALLGALLLGAGDKGDEKVQVQFRGDGPLRGVVALADAEGRARGYVGNPRANPPRVEGELDVHNAVGAGVLTVVRQRPGQQPYTGVVQIVTGTIAQDLAHYLDESEQSRTAVALGVQQGARGGVTAAAGFLVQALPGASAEEIDRLEENVASTANPSELVLQGLAASDIAARLLDGLGARPGAEAPVRFHCGCDTERVGRAVKLLGHEEIDHAIREGEVLEVRCRFCAEAYDLGSDALRDILESS